MATVTKPKAKAPAKRAAPLPDGTMKHRAPRVKAAPPASGLPKGSKKVVAPAPVEHKLRIRVRAYEHKILDLSVKQIMDTAARFDAVVVGPVPLPTEIKRWTVNRSTFVYKDAREQFEMRIHKRLIDILNPSPRS
jgi:small subunit ribosomal protein S10